MATQTQNRRKAILAVILALLAAGTLCVWGVAAAGFTISSPVIDSIVSVFSGNGGDRSSVNGGAGADAEVGLPGDGGGDTGDGTDGDGDGEGDGSGDGEDGSDDDVAANGDSSSCFLGVLCINANVDATGNTGVADDGDGTTAISLAADADVDSDSAGNGDTNCFLGLICLTANAATQDGVDSIIDANVDGDGVDLDADADVDDDELLNGTLDLNDDDNGCLLGVICLDADADVNGDGSNVDANATIGATINSWWNTFVSLFAGANAS
jgi:hypothetical protein